MLTAIASIVLGMGITTTAVYITLAALIVPSLEHMGVLPMAAHMFAFYYGVISTITPPVALASFAAAGIAGTPPMATAVESSKVGIAAYLVPFIFVYNPSLLFEGPLWLTALSCVAGWAGVWALAAVIVGWLHGAMSPLPRLTLLLSAIALLSPPQLPVLGISGYLITLTGALAVGAIYYSRSRAKARLATS